MELLGHIYNENEAVGALMGSIHVWACGASAICASSKKGIASEWNKRVNWFRITLRGLHPLNPPNTISATPAPTFFRRNGGVPPLFKNNADAIDGYAPSICSGEFESSIKRDAIRTLQLCAYPPF